MKVLKRFGFLLTIALTFFCPRLLAEQFTISTDDIVSQNVPGPGAGLIDLVTDSDTYLLSATNGQIIFLEEISVSDAFKGWLYWDLKSPSGASLVASYFEGRHEGRRVLPETGVYTLRVRVLNNNPEYVGSYSFRVRSVPPDDLFPIEIGDTVSDGNPRPGAGRLEAPGANDVYEFSAAAGQHAWFEELSVDPAFAGWLQWEVKSPSGQSLFRSYLGGSQEGRKTFEETGVHQLRIFSGIQDLGHTGPYSFRIQEIPPDQYFSIALGQNVTNGFPAQGAGNIEVAGAQDFYSFEGTAGETVFFEHFGADSSLGGYLRWETKTPSGQTLFSSYLSSGSSVGRKTLPESGLYTMRIFAQANDPALTGTYGFRVSPVQDSGFPLEWGQVVAESVPGTGAGRIEDAGGQDVYTFSGLAGQRIVLEELSADASFAGWLRWELLGTNNQRIASDFLAEPEKTYLRLPATGAYTVKIQAAANNPAYVGAYSFRVYSEVFAGPDHVGVSPTNALVIPKARFLCNDKGEPGDSLQVALTQTATLQGGTVSETADSLVYTPPPGFTGQDSFQYRLSGSYGGVASGTVQVEVAPDAENHASLVSFTRLSDGTFSLCLFGHPAQAYLVQTSPDLEQWSDVGTISSDQQGGMDYVINIDEQASSKYFRFPKLP